jgi:hypothetical protein
MTSKSLASELSGSPGFLAAHGIREVAQNLQSKLFRSPADLLRHFVENFLLRERRKPYKETAGIAARGENEPELIAALRADELADERAVCEPKTLGTPFCAR